MTDSETSIGIEMTTSKKERLQQEKQDYENRIADPITGAMGHLGPWQFWICLTIFLMKFPVGMHQLATVFLAPPAKYKCISPSENVSSCSDECQEVEYDRSVFEETIITEWDLICDKQYLANLVQTLFMFGILVGNITFGIWSDKYGRRPPLVFSCAMQLICGVLDAVVPWFWLFCIFRFLLAVATGGSMMTSFVLIMEITGSKKREVMSILYQIPFNLGHTCLPLVSYFLRDWRWFQFAISSYSVILLSYYFIIPESPRWLFSTGRLDRAEVILKKAAIRNKMPTNNIRSDMEEALKRKNLTQNTAKKGTLLDIFRYPKLRLRTICMSYNWFVCGLAYYGVSQYIGEIGGNIFINVAVAGSLGVPGSLICVPMTKYLGRKITLIISNTLTGICMLTIAILPENSSWVTVGLSSVGVFGLSISFPNVYLYGGELFPTVVRNAGLGFESMIARVGAMIAPFVSKGALIAYWVPPLIFGIFPLTGAGLTFLLPETRGQPLPETIEDGENFGNKSKAVPT